MQELWMNVATVAFAAGAAFAGAKVSINGVKSDVKELKEDVRFVRQDSGKMRERMSAVETELKLMK